MKKNSLSQNGLSLSQAQSISNLCFQRASDIAGMISGLNNASKTLKIGNETYIETVGKAIPPNIIDLLKEKAILHATQAFLMENIKAKDFLLKELKSKYFSSPLIYPESPKFKYAEMLELVEESWGWEQLSISEYNEYLEAEAFAAHIGQFIHKGCPLDILRKELSNMKTLEWMIIKDGEKTPLKVDIHHSSSQLLQIHEELAGLHRKFEQKVNYFKAKVKNLVTEENARISNVNSVLQAEVNSFNDLLRNQYNSLIAENEAQNLKLMQDFEKTRQEDIQKVAQLKISVDKRFQAVVDLFLKQLES